MTLALLIVLATAHLEDANLVVLAVRHHRGDHSRAGHQGRADLAFPLPLPTASTWSSMISWPTSAAICSTLIFSPEATRYCLPPVFMTAYMSDLSKDQPLGGLADCSRRDALAQSLDYTHSLGAAVADSYNHRASR